MENVCSYKDFLTSTISIKDVDGKKGIVTGYFADFDTLDHDGDVIKKGSFTKTISLNGPQSQKPRIKHLLNHNPSQPLGVIQVLKEDNKGLYYESKVGNHALGMDFIKMVESDLIKEHSIGYQVKKFNQVSARDEYKEGDVWRELTELKLWEGSSLTAWGANPNTPLTGMKGLKTINELEINKLVNQAEAIEEFCRHSKATDETIEQLLTYNRQLLKVIAESRSGLSTISQENKEDGEEKNDIECPSCGLMTKNVESGMGYIKCSHCQTTISSQTHEIIPAKSVQPQTVDCPSCFRITHNTTEEKGYTKCHRCDAVFVYGSKEFIKI